MTSATHWPKDSPDWIVELCNENVSQEQVSVVSQEMFTFSSHLSG